MADIENEESLLLAFKESGVEFVEDAGRAVGKLGDQFKDVDKTAKQAADVLKETSNVTQGLKDKIRDLKGELENLKDAFRSGLIESEDAFIERAGDFESGIARHKKALKLLEGDDDTGGLKGTASAAIKAEKAIGALVSGSGLGRLPGMLEGVTGAIGLSSGAGLAVGGLILAFESIIPKVEKFIEKMDGAAAAAVRTAEQVKIAHDQMAKFIGQPTEEEEAGAKAVKPLLAGQRATKVAQGIEQVLRRQGVGLMAPGERALSEAFLGPEATAEEERKQQDQAVAIQRASIMRDLMAGRTPAISQVSGMAGQFPGLFPTGTEQRFRQALPENLDAAKKQARDAEEQSREAEQEYAKQEAAKNKQERDDAFDRRMVASEEERVARENAKEAQDEANTQIHQDRQDAAAQRRADAQAKRHAAEDARNNTPVAMNRRAVAEEQNEVMGEAQTQNQKRAQFGGMLHPAFEASDLQQVVAQVGRNRLMNSSLGFTLAQQVDYFMGQLEAKMVADFTRGMGTQDRSSRNINPFAGL